MRNFHRLLFPLSAALLLAGCEPTRTVTVEQRRPQDPLLAKFAGNYNLQRSEDGSLQAQSDIRSRFEGRAFRDGRGDQADALGKRQFRTKDYRTTESKLPRDYRRAGENFATPQAREQNNSFRESGEQFATGQARDAGRRYASGTYETGQAREDSGTFATSTYRDSTERRQYRVDDVGNISAPADNRAPIRIQDVRQSLGKP